MSVKASPSQREFSEETYYYIRVAFVKEMLSIKIWSRMLSVLCLCRKVAFGCVVNLQ